MVDSVSGTSTTSSSDLGTSRKTIADNFDTFLQLLTTQLKNQNPLEPLDTNQFTQQLVQFTSVEQQLKTNEFLEAMMQSSQNSTNAQAVSYVGKTVTASGATTDLIDGVANWVYRVDAAAENTNVTIKDSSGNVVYTENLSLAAGTDQIVWDGTTSTGTKLTSGQFTITIDARDADGQYVPVTTEMQGVVEGVDVSGSEPYILIGDLRIPLSSISAVHATGSESEEPEAEQEAA
ncbi:flagellar hook assembly protein FlgD [Pelagibacterium halotolerans]|uniref:Basal-body rod modification protein FlgD n=1 Tax=Pelagibacterium halotolerans (strain DSM 22347 / JCM 15775 / CGMCC 1.7692 / B2) TaxID=1082931 RepID=G4R928_PELHB|nr:flagellar hook assembly protein FlgD [Pelagibacterium halotolerans]AEQ52408.1 flagellar basal-body rod modification protein FlgD [Pelagibacterium halotolerans B2]QJR17861.1 flagellar hook assembly protein FlgD [Pelagibacterium halotolerans]SEA35529.1 flagellar basal-body rod modification protein FlgD [Pelagibacterium halotolerans]